MTTTRSGLKCFIKNEPWIKKSFTDRQRTYKRKIFFNTTDDISFFFGVWRRQKCVKALNE